MGSRMLLLQPKVVTRLLQWAFTYYSSEKIDFFGR